MLCQWHTADQWLAAKGRPALFVNVPAGPAQGRGGNRDVVVTLARAREQAAHVAHAEGLSIL